MKAADITPLLLSRLWSRIAAGAIDDCWEWQGYKRARGHGMMKVAGKLIPPYRIVWMLSHGDVPDGMLIRHHCDNGACCNPLHLEVGTVADNMRDMAVRGRCRSTKLRKSEVLEIRASGKKVSALAREYGVSRKSIYKVLSRESWAWI